MFRGLEELRVRKAIELPSAAAGLRKIGAMVEEADDGLIIDGTGGEPLEGGGPIETHLDHRIAMSFAVAGLASYQGVTIDDIARLRPASRAFSTCCAIWVVQMSMALVDGIGLLGSTLFIAAYICNVAKRLNFIVFNLLNLVGAFC